MGTKIIFLYLQCDERWVRRLPWLTNKRFSSAEPFIFYGKELESKKYKGLYLTGELIDVDGICGGYNLHWAFTSGYLAGKSIADKRKKA